MVLNLCLTFDPWLPKSYFLFLSHATFQKLQAFAPEEIQTYKHLTSVNTLKVLEYSTAVRKI